MWVECKYMSEVLVDLTANWAGAVPAALQGEWDGMSTFEKVAAVLNPSKCVEPGPSREFKLEAVNPESVCYFYEIL